MEFIKLILLMIIFLVGLFLVSAFLENLLKRNIKGISKEIYKIFREVKKEINRKENVYYQVRNGNKILREFKNFEEAKNYLKSFTEEERENMVIVEVTE